jgi:predicted Zn-dependent protease
MQTGRPAIAAVHYDKSIVLDVNPTPGLYLKRARALMQARPAPLPPQELDGIVAGIDRGIARHGELVTYLELLIELYAANGGHRRALDTIARLPERVRTTPVWQMRRAELLLQAGEKESAAVAYHAVIEAVEQLPPYRRDVKANTDARQQAQLALQRLDSGRKTR